LASLIGKSKTNVIVAGDLNCEPDSEGLSPLMAVVKSPQDEPIFTFPAANPTAQIDYVLVDQRAKWTTSHVEVIDDQGASDHRPLLVVFGVE